MKRSLKNCCFRNVSRLFNKIFRNTLRLLFQISHFLCNQSVSSLSLSFTFSTEGQQCFRITRLIKIISQLNSKMENKSHLRNTKGEYIIEKCLTQDVLKSFCFRIILMSLWQVPIIIVAKKAGELFLSSLQGTNSAYCLCLFGNNGLFSLIS